MCSLMNLRRSLGRPRFELLAHVSMTVYIVGGWRQKGVRQSMTLRLLVNRLTGSGSTISTLCSQVARPAGFTFPKTPFKRSSTSPVRTHLGSESGRSRSRYIDSSRDVGSDFKNAGKFGRVGSSAGKGCGAGTYSFEPSSGRSSIYNVSRKIKQKRNTNRV